MNKNFLLILVVTLIVLLSAGGLLIMGKSKPAAPATSTNEVPLVTETENTVTQDKILTDLFALAGDQQCTFKDEETDEINTVYTADGQVRGYFKGGNMYSDGIDVYVWMDNESNGFKMSVNSAEQISSTLFPATNEKNTLNDFSCTSWSPDDSIFEVPPNVTFSDPSSLLPSGAAVPSGLDEGMPSVSCSTCDSLTGDAQTQCRAALGC